MPKLKISKAAKRRVLLANKARLERSLAKVSGQLEACLSCDADRLRRDLAKLDAQADRERARVVSRLGLRPEEAAELLQPAARKVPRKALAKGAAREQAEHGLGPALSTKIAADHLSRDPDFYTGPQAKKTAKRKASKRKSRKTEGSRAKAIANRRQGSQDFAARMRAAKAAKAKAKKRSKKSK